MGVGRIFAPVVLVFRVLFAAFQVTCAWLRDCLRARPQTRRAALACDVVTAALANLLRCRAGRASARRTAGMAPVKVDELPAQPPTLYEFIGCPFCGRVREAVSMLELDVEVRPVPRETLRAYGVCVDSRFRPEVLEKRGRLAFPFLDDANTGTTLYESNDIVDYLFERYAPGVPLPWLVRFGRTPLGLGLIAASSLLRPLNDMGVLRMPSRRPEGRVELWAAWGDAHGRIIQELLCSLEIPYLWHTVVDNSAKLDEFAREFGHRQLPLLRDERSGFTSTSLPNIIEFLETAYKTGDCPRETVLDYSTAGADAGHGTMPGVGRPQQQARGGEATRGAGEQEPRGGAAAHGVGERQLSSGGDSIPDVQPAAL